MVPSGAWTARSAMMSLSPQFFSLSTETQFWVKTSWMGFYGQNLPNSSFLEKILMHSMRMKHICKLDCFWNSSMWNSSYNTKSSFSNSIYCWFIWRAFKKKKKKPYGTRVWEPQVPFKKKIACKYLCVYLQGKKYIYQRYSSLLTRVPLFFFFLIHVRLMQE